MELVLVARFRRCLPWLAALFLLGAAQLALAQVEPDPPARVGNVSYTKGGVVFAPEGESEWLEVPQNRPLTVGDRLWTDRGGWAELHLGSSVLQLNGETHLGISALDERAAQLILMQGAVIARVREVQPGENFEIDTPNLALRALQPGEFRVDVNADGSQTRVVVLSGLATVFGDGGQSIHMGQGQELVFAGRFLAQVQGARYEQDAFAQWSAERNRAEDASIAARHVPRAVVGYPQLDQHGTWSRHPEYGTVWYPAVSAADWAPYRYGRWTYIRPWGWTWLDDASWGFATSHYGRWASIGSRWAWVPGRMAHRPVYSPALVSFVGGSGGFSFSVNSGPAVGWYPLGPGEAWWPWYRTSPRYVTFANPHINLSHYHRQYDNHMFRQRAVTAVREDDFRRGRPVREAWRPVQPGTNLPSVAPPARPDFRERRTGTPPVNNFMPRVQDRGAPPAMSTRDWSQVRTVPIDRPIDWERSTAVREQARAEREQFRLQRDAEREARRQIVTGEVPQPQQLQPSFQPPPGLKPPPPQVEKPFNPPGTAQPKSGMRSGTEEDRGFSRGNGGRTGWQADGRFR